MTEREREREREKRAAKPLVPLHAFMGAMSPRLYILAKPFLARMCVCVRERERERERESRHSDLAGLRARVS